jgi:hypothetical protein
MTLVQTYYDIGKLGLRRADAFAVDCPECGASADNPCTGRRDPVNTRISPHLQRYNAAAVARYSPASSATRRMMGETA